MKEHTEIESDDSTTSDAVEMEEHEEIESEDGTNSEAEEMEESEDENDSTKNQSKFMGNPALADVFQKILKTNKPKNKKTLVLSRAKKLADVVPKTVETPKSFEVDGEIAEIKDEVNDTKSTVEELSKKPEKKSQRISIRSKPSISDRGRERTLQKIATKGVVQLFNAVRQQQTELEKKLIEAGPLERKREKVLKSIDKRAFLDVLMGGSKSIPVSSSTEETKSEDKSTGKIWGVLRDDFVMGAKLKDWDKNTPEDDTSSEVEDMDSD